MGCVPAPVQPAKKKKKKTMKLADLNHSGAEYLRRANVAIIKLVKGAMASRVEIWKRKCHVHLTALHGPLYEAVKAGNHQIAAMHIRKGASPNWVSYLDELHNAPLHHAAQRGDAEICGLLLSNGANFDAENCFRYSALHFAAKVGSKPVCRMLIQALPRAPCPAGAHHAQHEYNGGADRPVRTYMRRTSN
jgi:hypothetical protein